MNRHLHVDTNNMHMKCEDKLGLCSWNHAIYRPEIKGGLLEADKSNSKSYCSYAPGGMPPTDGLPRGRTDGQDEFNLHPANFIGYNPIEVQNVTELVVHLSAFESDFNHGRFTRASATKFCVAVYIDICAVRFDLSTASRCSISWLDEHNESPDLWELGTPDAGSLGGLQFISDI